MYEEVQGMHVCVFLFLPFFFFANRKNKTEMSYVCFSKYRTKQIWSMCLGDAWLYTIDATQL